MPLSEVWEKLIQSIQLALCKTFLSIIRGRDGRLYHRQGFSLQETGISRRITTLQRSR